MEKAEEATTENVNERLKSKKSGDILVNIHDASQAYAKYIQEAREESDPIFKKSYIEENLSDETKERGIRLKKRLYDIIMPQIKMLDDYILKLSKSQRFKNVQGPLYDPNTGWNRGYRVFASDLRTIIPLNPFESLHKTNDIFFGKPAEEESESIGFMPFTWIQDGVKISVHPILYELARAKAIRGIYEQFLKDYKGSIWELVSNNPIATKLGAYAIWWKQWNSALATHAFGSYKEYVGSEDDVLFKDRFIEFLEKVRAGEIRSKDNNLETV